MAKATQRVAASKRKQSLPKQIDALTRRRPGPKPGAKQARHAKAAKSGVGDFLSHLLDKINDHDRHTTASGAFRRENDGSWKFVPLDELPPEVRAEFDKGAKVIHEFQQRETPQLDFNEMFHRARAGQSANPFEEIMRDLTSRAAPQPKSPFEAMQRDLDDHALREMASGRPMTGEAPKPAGNPKAGYGLQKPSSHFVAMNTLRDVMRVMSLGSDKYGLKNYRAQPVAASTYYDAAIRHLIDWFEGPENQPGVPQDNDPESGVTHLAHVIACCTILMDAMRMGLLIDDRCANEVKHPNT